MKIIPAINAQAFEEVKNKIDSLKDLTQEFHIDIASENFCNYQTWNNAVELGKLDENLKISLHLMVRMLPQEILKWNNKRIKQFILHLEATNNPDGLLKIAKRLKKEIYIAIPPSFRINPRISPPESALDIEKYLPFVNGVLILGVEPGKSGQKMYESTYNRLQIAKSKLKDKQKLIVDGGINKENIEKIIEYQPDSIILGSAIFNTENPAETYLKFVKF